MPANWRYPPQVLIQIIRPLFSYFAERDRSFRVSVTAGGMLNE